MVAQAFDFTRYRDYVDIKKLKVIIYWVEDHRVSLVRSTADIAILEVGVGTGNLSLPLASLGYRVLGIDVDPHSIDYLQANNSFENARFEVLDILTDDAIPHAGVFDVVVCSEVLEHLHDPAFALKRLRQILSPYGLLIITTPNGYGPYEFKNRALKPFKRVARNLLRQLGGLDRIRRWRGGDVSVYTGLSTLNPLTPHVQFFSPRSLEILLRETGFRVKEWRNSNFLSLGRIRHVWMLGAFDCILADLLPHMFASGWYIKCQ